MTPEERSETIVKNMSLVHFIAHKMCISPYAYYSYEDLAQEGMIGLINAVDRFKPELGFQFSTYASMIIRGTILRFIRENQYGLKYTRGDLDAYTKLQRSGKEIEELTSQDLEELGIKPKHLAAIISMNMSSLDAPSSVDSENLTVMDRIPAVTNELSDEFYEGELDFYKDYVLQKFHSETARDICEEWYYSQCLGMPARQPYLAVKYGISQAQVSRHIKRFKEYLLEALNKAGYEVSEFLKE